MSGLGTSVSENACRGLAAIWGHLGSIFCRNKVSIPVWQVEHSWASKTRLNREPVLCAALPSSWSVLCSSTRAFFQGKETKWTGLTLAVSDAATQYLHTSLGVNCFPTGDELNAASISTAAPGQISPHHLHFRMEEREGAYRLHVELWAPRNTAVTWPMEKTAHYPQLTRAGAITLCLAPDMAAQWSCFNLQSTDKVQTLGGQWIFMQLLKP